MIGSSNTVPHRGRRPFRAAVALVLLGLLAAACKEKEGAYVAPPPPAVTVQSPVVEDITQYLDFTGRMEAVESVEVRARVKGYLRKPLFRDGEIVEVGQKLYRIDPSEYEAALAGAKALHEAAVAKRNLAEATWQRMDQAAQKGAISKLDAIEAKAKLEVAEAEINTVLSKVRDAELQLGYTTITSPIAGRINLTYVTEGNLVGQSEPTLLTTVVSMDPIYAFFSISERDLLALLKMRPEERKKYESLADVPVEERRKVVIQLANGDEYPHMGTVDYIDNTIDPTTGTMTGRCVIPNPDFILFPGLFVRVRAPFETKGAILVPEVAVQRDLAGYFVMTVDEKDTVVRTDIQPGGRLGDRRVVKEGLTPDQRVIVNGLQRARPGIRVKITEPEKPKEASPGAGEKGGGDPAKTDEGGE